MATSPALYGTTCKLFMDLLDRRGADVDFIVTSGGSAYEVIDGYRMRSRHPNRWRFTVMRIDPASVPDDPVHVCPLYWYPRTRTH